MNLSAPGWLNGRTAVIAIAIVLALTAAFSAGAMARGALQAPREVVHAVPKPSTTPSPPFIGIQPRDRPAQLSTHPPVSVVGPVFGPTEPTITRNDLGIPFAFRLPPGWACVRYSADQAHGVRRACIDSDVTHFTEQVRIVISECEDGCQPTTRAEMTRGGWPSMWAPPATAGWATRDADTRFVERVGPDGRYHLWMAHFATANGGAAIVRIGVAVDGPTASRETLQKIVNDIRTQT